VACRDGETLVVAKLDRLARSLRDAKDIVEGRTRREVKPGIGGSAHDPTDPVGRLLFNALAMVAEFEADLIRARTWEGMSVAKAMGKLRGKQPRLSQKPEAHLGLPPPGRNARDGGTCRTLLSGPFNRLPGK
jgi:DNA invertase Pin-like site-specific DNA recombinase